MLLSESPCPHGCYDPAQCADCRWRMCGDENDPDAVYTMPAVPTRVMPSDQMSPVR